MKHDREISQRPQSERLTALPRRRFLPRGVRPKHDDCGFLRADVLDQTIDMLSLLQDRAVLVLAPPWTGKTFVSRALNGYFRQTRTQPNQRGSFGKYFYLSRVRLGGTEIVLPEWWNEWRRSKRSACWMIDGVDEDAPGGARIHAALDRIEQLRSDERSRLRLILFCRPNEIPPELEERLGELYPISGKDKDGALNVVQLAPLDAQSARELEWITSDDDFRRVCELLRRNHLQACGGYPAVIRTLSKLDDSSQLAPADVWRHVIYDMLRVPHVNKRDALTVIDDVFDATAHVATALTFSGHDQISTSWSNSPNPTPDQLITSDNPRARDLRDALVAGFASSVFECIGGNYRIADEHVREWLAAFVLRDAALLRLRPLVANENGKPYEQYRGVLGLLAQISQYGEVREWIVEVFQGVPPIPDAAPLTLDQAITYLDRLLVLASDTKRGFSRWEYGPNLAALAVPGLGKALRERIVNKDLSIGQREFLIDVAVDVDAHEAAEAAVTIVTDDTEDDHLRVSAAVLLHCVGTEEDVRAMEDVVQRMAAPPGSELESLTAALIQSLLEHGIWTVSHALKHAPPLGERIGGLTWSFASRVPTRETSDLSHRVLSCQQYDLHSSQVSGGLPTMLDVAVLN